MRSEAFRIIMVPGVLGAILAGVAMLKWSFGLFAASFSLFGGPIMQPPEPGHLFLINVAAPTLLGLATVPITLVLGTG